jgi:hypothetical protein
MFAINAAPFNNNSIENFSNNKTENTNRNKTIRKRIGGDFSSVNVPTKTIDYDSELTNNSTNDSSYLINQYKLPVQQTNISKNNIESLITRLHNKNDDSNEELPDFNPPPIPNSSGVNRREERNNNLTNINIDSTDSIKTNTLNNNSNNTDDPVTVEAFNNNALQRENNNVNNYFQQYPSTYFSSDLNSNNNVNNKQLIEKLNYMINLLEEQKDEKTGHVTEEIILYSFLGVFIIFIIDSFARAGKYVR